ncbi:neurogenic locus Notch protein isoform X1 [Hydra vulgaris]|uniref:neurogenic locus Notch protein isoform X1 n=1 Tax=Hydra vulgaris TaxID=6087 RepID=UPI001F5FCEE1|nr:neurogenic locus Notch protein isoform X1 [Hydra vulgaris]
MNIVIVLVQIVCLHEVLSSFSNLHKTDDSHRITHRYESGSKYIPLIRKNYFSPLLKSNSNKQKNKRWVDVDEDDANAANANRQKTPSEPNLPDFLPQNSNKPTSIQTSDLSLNDFSSLSNLVGDFDKGLTNKFKSVNDITNLESAALEQSQQQSPVIQPLAALSPNEQVVGEPIPVTNNPFFMSELNHMDQSHGTEVGIPLEAFHPNIMHLQHQANYQIDMPNQAFHSSDPSTEVMIPQSNIIYSPNEHREEGPIHKQEDGAPIEKFLPGKSLYLRPIRIIHRQPHRLFQHRHVFHKPRIIVIRRRHRYHPNDRSDEISQQQLICGESDCKNGGSCNIVNNQIKCICLKGFKGNRCEEISNCHPDPCKNGGKCTETDVGFTCTCTSSFFGERCETQSFCHPNPCRNNGYCYEKGSTFECSCEFGFKGPTCALNSFCHPIDPCQNGGLCSEDDSTYKCSCAKGYSGTNCEVKRQVCSSTICQNGGTCLDDGGVLRCSCIDEYKGKYCEEKVFRVCSTSTCLFGGSCIEVNQFEFKCVCPTGRTGKRCSAIADDPCTRCHKHATCNQDTCQCKEGYSGSGYFCERERSNCHPNPCENEATCIDKYYYLDDTKSDDSSFYNKDSSHDNVVSKSSEIEGEFMAEHGFGEQNPIKQINDMSMESKAKYLYKRSINTTMNSGLVILLRSKVKSNLRSVYLKKSSKDELMKHNFTNLHNSLSSYFIKKQVKSNNDNEYSDKNRIKRNEDDLPSGVNKNDLNFYGFACICPMRFKGHKCEIPEPCNPNPCGNNGVCSDKNGVPSCKCEYPYVGMTCNATDSCKPNPCKNAGKCTDNDGVAVCTCLPRYEGDKCEIDRCDQCHTNAECSNGVCKCKQGFLGDGKIVCVKDRAFSDPCNDQVCNNGGTCVATSETSFRCFCKSMYYGKFCEEKMHPTPAVLTTTSTKTTQKSVQTTDRPQCHPNPCLNDGQCIVSGDIGYNCLCTPQFKGQHCEDDKCMECDLQALCVDGHCHCHHGYHGDGYTCTKNDQCDEPCPRNGICTHGICVCEQGYYMDEDKCKRVPFAAKHNPHERRLELVHSKTSLSPPPPSPPPLLGTLPPPQSHSQHTPLSPPYLQPVLLNSPNPVNYLTSLPKYTSYQQPVAVNPPNSYMTTSTEHYMLPNNYVTNSNENIFKPTSLNVQYPLLDSQPIVSPAKPIISLTSYNQQSNQNPFIRSPMEKFEKKLKDLMALGLSDSVARALIKSAPTRIMKKGNVNYAEDIVISVYQNLGCWKDTEYWWDPDKRAIKSVEGKHPKVSGDYNTRKDPIGKCADTAKELGFKLFALQNGGQCFTSADAQLNYMKYGRSDKCRNGVGGPLVSDVYSL